MLPRAASIVNADDNVSAGAIQVITGTGRHGCQYALGGANLTQPEILDILAYIGAQDGISSRPKHRHPMQKITLYTTDQCRFCMAAKKLLAKRDIDFIEVDLAKDPAGRAELVALTGMNTFPQFVVGSTPLGGFQELLDADRSGRLPELVR